MAQTDRFTDNTDWVGVGVGAGAGEWRTLGGGWSWLLPTQIPFYFNPQCRAMAGA